MNILLAYDGSAESARASEWAARLASGESGSTISVIGVVQTLEMAAPTRDAIDPTVRPDTLEKAINDVAARLTERVPAAPVQASLVAGNPAEQIIDAGRRADVIVIGKSGAHGIGRFLIGGVAERVARHSRTPVLIAP